MTEEQKVVGLIRDLRAKALKYNQLMLERDRAEADDDNEDDDTVSRSTQSIDKEIDELLDDTMTTTEQILERIAQRLITLGNKTRGKSSPEEKTRAAHWTRELAKLRDLINDNR